MSSKPKSFTDPNRTTPIGMLRYAIEFYAAAVAADAAIGDSPGYEITAPTPVNYLMGHAIELGLKAFLLHSGSTLADIMRIGHRLCLAYEEAREAGLDAHFPPDAVDVSVLDALDALYSDKQFEYIETGPKTFPVFGPSTSLANFYWAQPGRYRRRNCFFRKNTKPVSFCCADSRQNTRADSAVADECDGAVGRCPTAHIGKGHSSGF